MLRRVWDKSYLVNEGSNLGLARFGLAQLLANQRQLSAGGSGLGRCGSLLLPGRMQLSLKASCLALQEYDHPSQLRQLLRHCR